MEHTGEFESWGEFLRYIETPLEIDINRCQSHTGGKSFTGTDTYDEAIEIANEGWKEIRPRVEELTDSVTEQIKPMMINTIESVYDVSGGFVDMDRFLTGEPSCMVSLRPIEVKAPSRVITIVVAGAVSAAVSTEKIITRGSAICGLIEALQTLNYGVELYLENTAHSRSDSSSRFTVLVKIKDASENMDMDRVMFAIAHPSMLRRLVFRYEELQDRKFRSTFGAGDMGGSYGFPPFNNVMADKLGADINIDAMHLDENMTVDPKQWILDNLSRYGLIVED